MDNTDVFIYGAAVQGIQNFIFRTNELKDIVGASELVEQICAQLFNGFLGKTGQPIVNAAGNIKCVFYNVEECQKIVREFPKRVMEAAPGITISQAVVKTTNSEFATNFSQLMDELEQRLHIQRNKPPKSMTLGLMGMERSRKTGLPAVEVIRSGEYVDEATLKKRELSEGGKVTVKLCEKSFGITNIRVRDIALNIEDLTDRNDWIAIIHADGNGLGEVVRKSSKTPNGLSEFSKNLNKATCQAANEAFKSLAESNAWQSGGIYPFRPVVLGGDDMTMICRASLALDYVKAYIENFEKATAERLEKGLTACAGVAYIKSSYPFHYGYQLAEKLCSQAKKVSKSSEVNAGSSSAAPSSVMFYKVQSSFIEDFDKLIEKEKTPQQGHSFNFGPYFLKDTPGYWTIEALKDCTRELATDDGNRAKTAIRKWMTHMHTDQEKAFQTQKRSTDILTGRLKDVFKKATIPTERNTEEMGKIKFYPAADIIELNTILTQTTKDY